MGYMESPETLNSAACEEKKSFVFICRLAKLEKKGSCTANLCCSLISADNGGPVAGDKAPFLCSFLDIEISKILKHLLLYSFGHKLNLISGENSPLKEVLSLHRNHPFYSIKL